MKNELIRKGQKSGKNRHFTEDKTHVTNKYLKFHHY